MNYKIYTASLTQSGVSAPTAVVLQNTLGVTPTFAYDSPGVYSIIAAGIFDSAKLVVLTGLGFQSFYYTLAYNISDINTLTLRTYDILGASVGDGLMLNTSIEIRVYP